MVVAVTYVGTNTNGTGGTGYTFTSEPVGAAAADRKTVVVVTGIQNSGTNGGPPTVTIGGTAATADATSVGNSSGTGTRAIVGIYSRDNPGGTTATIVVTFALAMFECVIYVYSLVPAAAGAAVDLASDAPPTAGGATTSSLDLDTVTGGAVVAGVMAFDMPGGAGSVTWTGVTPDANTVIYTNDRRGVASAAVVTGATPRTVLATYPSAIGSSGDSYAAVAASWTTPAAAAGATKQMHNYRQRRV
jgi:hypothetical protein